MERLSVSMAVGGATALVLATAAHAAPKYVWEGAANISGLSVPISNSDLIQGQLPLRNNDLAGSPGYTPINNAPSGCEVPVENPAPTLTGFHGATPDQTGARITDGLEGANVDSVLSDFTWPSAVLQYNFTSPTSIGEIRVFAGNPAQDGRVFQDYDVFISTDTNPDPKLRTFTLLISEVISSNKLCAGPGTGDGYSPNTNNENSPVRLGSTLTRVFDDANPVLAANVTSVRFVFYPVDNTQGVFWDRWLGPNSCIGLTPDQLDPQDHDGFKRPFVGSIIKEIDILATRGVFENCTNGTDDDGDGQVDGNDQDCLVVNCPPENCSNGIDDTGDGLVDCADPDCLSEPACNPEICDNGVDDNGNELVDCEDPQCASQPICSCSDPFADADGDGDVDQEDFAVMQSCYTGLNDSIAPGCECFDRNGDQRIEGLDINLFILCASGPDVPASPTCDD